MSKQAASFASGRLRDTRRLLKDPFAVFSSGWFARRLGCGVVISVRHPAAVVSSLKRLRWTFDPAQLLSQPLLMRDWLEPMREELERARATPDDIITNGSLLWRAVYSTVAELERRHPEFIVVRSEDLALDPMSGYERLYATLGLELTPAAARAVVRSSQGSNKKEVKADKPIDIRLDSRANIDNWRHRLELSEIKRIRSLTGAAGDRYYGDRDWH